MPDDDYAERELRELLRDPQWSLPAWPDAPSRIRRAVRRQRLRTAGLAASLSAVAVAAVIVPISQLGGGTPQPLGPAGPPTAYVLTRGTLGEVDHTDAVTPLNLTTNRTGRPVRVPGATQEIMAPDGRALYVNGTHGVTVISTVTNRVARVIRLGPAGRMALAPDGKTLYVCSGPAVVPVSTATGQAGRPVRVSRQAPQWVVISQDGRTAYVTTVHSHKVYPIQLATRRVLPPVDVGGQPANSGAPDRTVVAPTGHVAYFGMKDQVTPVDTRTNTALVPIKISGEPIFIGFAPDGKMAYVTREWPADVVPIRVATDTALPPITFRHGFVPLTLGITPDGKTAYVTGAIAGGDSVVPIDLATSTALRPIKAGSTPDSVAITPDGKTAYVGDGGPLGSPRPARNTLTPIRTATNQAGRAIRVTGWPQQIVFRP